MVFLHLSQKKALGGDVLWQWRVRVVVNFDFRGGALALNRLVTAVPLSSLRQSKALESCMMPQMGLSGPRPAEGFVCQLLLHSPVQPTVEAALLPGSLWQHPLQSM